MLIDILNAFKGLFDTLERVVVKYLAIEYIYFTREYTLVQINGKKENCKRCESEGC